MVVTNSTMILQFLLIGVQYFFVPTSKLQWNFGGTMRRRLDPRSEFPTTRQK